jgi:hypothetical protein
LIAELFDFSDGLRPAVGHRQTDDLRQKFRRPPGSQTLDDGLDLKLTLAFLSAFLTVPSDKPNKPSRAFVGHANRNADRKFPSRPIGRQQRPLRHPKLSHRL